MNLAEQLNEKLIGIYNTSDGLYRAIISDDTGISTLPINNPSDINRGAAHDLIEYYRLHSKSIIDQLDYNNASGMYLDYFNNVVFELPRLTNETQEQQKDRVKYFVIGPKLGPAAIISAMRQFSINEPRIKNGGLDIAFADYSYASRYVSFRLDMPSDYNDNNYVYPAIAGSGADAGVFFFTLYLTGTSELDIPRVLSYLSVAVAAGTEYEVVIE